MFASTREDGLGIVRIFIIGAIIVAIPIALVTTTVRAAISEQLVYDYSVKHYDAHEASGIPESELLYANGEIYRYLTADYLGPLSIEVSYKDGTRGALFNARETAHMAEVRDLVRAMFVVQVAAVAAVLALAVIMLVLWPPRALAAAVLYGSVLTLAIIVMGGVLVATGFDAAWSQFHVIAFANDFWELDPDTDHLIQMYPEAFWERATIGVGGMIVLEAALLALIAGVYLYISRLQSQPDLPVRPDLTLPGRIGHARTETPPRLAPPNPRHYVR
ncbi:MAG TPA: TIGR01906 family membrane protein [Dehalococcoidia bacterium]|nr:TIGR01906 family membrane protein [Dehalococcoidia bacterium]